MNYPSPFGNEFKLKLAERLTPETAAVFKHIALDLNPIVLGVTYWNCSDPWQVPERRICDNFFLLVESGSLRVTVNGKPRILKRGDAMIVPEYVPHSFGLAPKCRQCSHFIAHALVENIAQPNPFTCFNTPFLSSALTASMLEILPGLVALRATSEDAAMFLMQQQFKFLMIEQAEQGHFKLDKFTAYRDPRIHRALTFINAAFASNIGVEDMAGHINLGVVRFRILFERETGMAPAAYLQRTRLLHAARLLARYDKTLSEIALESGFSSECYFCTAFKNYFQRTPGEYRKAIRRS